MALDLFSHIHRPGDGAGTLVALHGTGGDKESFADFAVELAPGWGVLALDGPVLEGGMKRFFRRRAEGVYDMADLEARTQDLARFLGAAFAEYGITPAAAVGLGYSNGANILAHLALKGQAPLGRLVLMHPLIPYDLADQPDLAGLSVLITAGQRDPIGPVALTERLGATFRDAGAMVRTVWQPGGHELACAELGAAQAFLGEPILQKAG